MVKNFALGAAVADLSTAVVAISENHVEQSGMLATLMVATILVSLWGVGSALYPLLRQELPEVVTLEDSKTDSFQHRQGL